MEIVLVVDDEPDIRTVVRGMLTAKGYTVLDTGDPQQAIRMSTQQAVHLLVTDVVMPLMKGTELAKRVQEVSPWTKVLLMSAYKVAEVTTSVGQRGRPRCVHRAHGRGAGRSRPSRHAARRVRHVA